MGVLNAVFKKHALDDKERKRIMAKIGRFMISLDRLIKKKKLNAQVCLGGSAAKGTFIKGDFDVDVFVRFAYSYRDKDIAGLLGRAITSLKPAIVHGSRDYYQATKSGIKYEIIPVLYVTEPKNAVNVTDMSPLHVEWINRHLKKEEGLRKEIILAKIFTKAQKIYGAESYINGFSGHVLDILVIYYGSFVKLLKASQKWKMYDVIDIEGHGTAKELNRSKLSPLIVIDPLQPERNAAAALSREKFEIFRKKAAEFFGNPSDKFFVQAEYDLKDLKKKAKENKLIILDIVALDGKEDVVGSKLLKVYMHILKHLKINDFVVKDSGWKWDKKKKAVLWYILDKKELSEKKLRVGPPLSAKNAAESFRKKHAWTFTKNDRLYSLVKREFRKPGVLVKFLVKQDYAAEKVGSAKVSIWLGKS